MATLDEIAEQYREGQEQAVRHRSQIKQLLAETAENTKLDDEDEEEKTFSSRITKAFSNVGATLANFVSSLSMPKLVSTFFEDLKKFATTLIGLPAILALMDWWEGGGRETISSGIRWVIDSLNGVSSWFSEQYNAFEQTWAGGMVIDWISESESIQELMGKLAALIIGISTAWTLASRGVGAARARLRAPSVMSRLPPGADIRGNATRMLAMGEVDRARLTSSISDDILPDGVRRRADGAIIDARGRFFNNADLAAMADGTFTVRGSGQALVDAIDRPLAETATETAADTAADAAEAAARRNLPGAVADAVTKYGLKAILGVGAAMGVVFTGQRLWAGDYIGAGQELVGIAIPSFLGSATVDLNLAVHDVYMSVYGTDHVSDFIRDPEGTTERLNEIRIMLGEALDEAVRNVSQHDMVNPYDEFGGLDAYTQGVTGGYNIELTPEEETELIREVQGYLEEVGLENSTNVAIVNENSTTVMTAPTPPQPLSPDLAFGLSP